MSKASNYYANMKRLASIKLPSSTDGIKQGIEVQKNFWRNGRNGMKAPNSVDVWEYSNDTHIDQLIDVRMMKKNY